MSEKKPILGLMIFMLYATSGNLSITLMACSILGILLLITGISTFHTFFIVLTIVMPPYSIITSIAGGYASKYSSKWERFQSAMPVKREDVTISQYLCTFIASTIGIPFIVITVGISIVLHESMAEIAGQVVSSTISIMSISLGIGLLLGALFFPLTCMKISKNRGESLAFVCVTVSLAIIAFLTWAGAYMNLSQYMTSLLRIAVSMISFILSYLLTKNLYGKLDL